MDIKLRMKKSVICFFSIIITHAVFAQTQGNFVIKVIAENDVNKRIDLMAGSFLALDTNLQSTLNNNQQILVWSQKTGDKITEAMSMAALGQGFRLSGNPQKGLEYNYNALSIAEPTGNKKLLAIIKNQLGNIYTDRGDYIKAVEMYRSVVNLASDSLSAHIQSWGFMNLGRAYLLMNLLDSCLANSQKAYELCLRIHYSNFMSVILRTLAGVHSKLGNNNLALAYFESAILEAKKFRTPRYLSEAFMGLAQYYNDNEQKDSAVYYAKNALAVVQNTTFIFNTLKPANLLKEIYKSEAKYDSAFHYSEIYKLASDSLFSTRTIEQIQLKTFEEELRQQQIVEKKLKAEEERQQNIQYALIAFSIISFIILFLLFSRTIIANEKWISFFGVVALLIVFEFLNLLLHPFLERITNHSPVLMLLGLVCIAALLVPLHHRLEKWAKTKLVEKNKQIRLIAAKKTIEQLERNSEKL